MKARHNRKKGRKKVQGPDENVWAQRKTSAPRARGWGVGTAVGLRAWLVTGGNKGSPDCSVRCRGLDKIN